MLLLLSLRRIRGRGSGADPADAAAPAIARRGHATAPSGMRVRAGRCPRRRIAAESSVRFPGRHRGPRQARRAVETHAARARARAHPAALAHRAGLGPGHARSPPRRGVLRRRRARRVDRVHVVPGAGAAAPPELRAHGAALRRDRPAGPRRRVPPHRRAPSRAATSTTCSSSRAMPRTCTCPTPTTPTWRATTRTSRRTRSRDPTAGTGPTRPASCATARSARARSARRMRANTALGLAIANRLVSALHATRLGGHAAAPREAQARRGDSRSRRATRPIRSPSAPACTRASDPPGAMRAPRPCAAAGARGGCRPRGAAAGVRTRSRCCSPRASAAALGEPAGVVCDALGRVWATDAAAHRLVRWDAEGRWLGESGALGQRGRTSSAGRPSLARLGSLGVAVLDVENRRVMVFDQLARRTDLVVALDDPELERARRPHHAGGDRGRPRRRALRGRCGSRPHARVRFRGTLPADDRRLRRGAGQRSTAWSASPWRRAASS